jgi:hypothetical protein
MHVRRRISIAILDELVGIHLMQRRRTMKAERTQEQRGTLSLSNLTVGNWVIVVSGCLFLVSLFLDWASAGGFIIQKGMSFMELGTSKSSGLPELNLFTCLAAIGCILLCLPFLKGQNRANKTVIPIVQLVLSIIGLLPFILLPFELKTWLPYGHVEIGGWLAIVAAFGLLIGAILTLTETRRQ